MTPIRRTAIAAGTLYLLTHVTAFAGRALYLPVLTGGTDAEADAFLVAAVFMEMVLAFAIIGTAVTLYPVLRRQNPAIALGYVGLRTLEAGIVALGVALILTVPSVRSEPALADALVAMHNWTFLIGPGLTCGVNTVLAAYLMLRSGLVPRIIAVLGLVGGPLVFLSNSLVMAGVYAQVSPFAGAAAVPVFAWELSLALYLVIHGFRKEAVARLGLGAEAR